MGIVRWLSQKAQSSSVQLQACSPRMTVRRGSDVSDCNTGEVVLVCCKVANTQFHVLLWNAAAAIVGVAGRQHRCSSEGHCAITAQLQHGQCAITAQVLWSQLLETLSLRSCSDVY